MSVRWSQALACVDEGTSEIVLGSRICTLAIFLDGKYVVSGDRDDKIQRWRVEDGMEMGKAMYVGGAVCGLTVSQDGRWIVSGTKNQVTVWDAESHAKVTEFKGHSSWVSTLDVSPDGSRIASGSQDRTACVWSLSTSQRLLGPWKHDNIVVAAKFSPDSQIIATATSFCTSVRCYDGQNGRLLFDIPIQVGSDRNQSLAWTNDSKQLFALSKDKHIYWVNVLTGTLIEKWPIHDNDNPKYLALASNSTFVVASGESFVSFWDTTTFKQIGPLIEHPDPVRHMCISANHDLAVGGGNKITVHRLRDILPWRYCNNASLEASLNEKITSLEKVVQGLQNDLTVSKHTADQKEDTIVSLRANLCAQEANSNKRAEKLEKIIQELNAQLAGSQEKADSLAQTLLSHERKHECETLYAQGRIIDAATSLVEITSTASEEVRANRLIMDWVVDFTNRCISMLEKNGDKSSNAKNCSEALAVYSVALTLGPSTPHTILAKWARMALTCGSVNEALEAALKFKVSRFLVYQTICDIFEEDDQIMRGIEYFRRMQSELAGDTSMHAKRAAWEKDFQNRCVQKLEKQGDAAMASGAHGMAIERYSDALSLGSTDLVLVDIFLKRSKIRALVGSWGEALVDADKAVELDPSSYKGYERRHAALLGMNRHTEAFRAFEMMLSKIERSSDPVIRNLRNQYFNATSAIRGVIEETTHDMPRVLIETATGRLYDKVQQAAAFEELPIYDELRSSMTTQLDHERIEEEVKSFYRYVMFSHRWEPYEPTFQDVEKTSVHELPTSPGFNKLKTFCKLVETLGFKWAWSDTCCINQLDKGVQQESLVAMFRWYRGSSLTIIHLLGVFSDSQEFGCLWRSIWNTRGWTYQEYLASMVVQFYTEDWKPYLNLDLFNHKESPAIVSEMEGAMNFASQELAGLCPGFDRVREKLYLASARQTTREEDVAYSLFGIFNVALPVVYGEGKQAVGRLLEHILTRSDNVTLLAWTGRSGTQHSYLPLDLTVYNKVMPPHVPSPLEAAEMDNMVTTLHSSFPDSSSVVTLYDRLCDLPPLVLVAGRLRLSGIVFPVTSFVAIPELDSGSRFRVYRATTAMLGDVEIKAMDGAFGTEGLLLIHPWIGSLVDPDFVHGVPRFDRATRALRLVVRLRQPFGALLLAPLGRVQCRRVATDCLIMARVKEEASLSELIGSIRTVDIQ